MISEEGKKWHFDSTGTFFKKYYEKLITENMLSSSEMFIENYKDDNGFEVSCSKFFFPFKKDSFIYLIPSEYVEKRKLPLLVERFERVSYSGKGYRLPTALKPMKIRPEMTMTFRELIDIFANTNHSNPTHDLLWRLISIILFVDRVNIRAATNPEFGKDSKLNIINSMTGEVGKVSNPTIAKLEYLLFNKVIFINEVSGINSQSRQDVEQFLLACGDFNNEYNKRSRAASGSSEKYDISEMSLVVAYNDMSQYTNSGKYFDFMWQNTGAINNRIIPFLFEGKILEDYTTPFDVNKVVKENYDDYVKFLRAVLYFRNNKQTEILWEDKEFDFGGNGRWERNFITLKKWISLYAQSQEEYDKLILDLYTAHLKYLKMVGFTHTSQEEITSDQPSSFIEEDMNPEHDRVLKYIEKYDKGEGVLIDTIMKATLTDETIIEHLKKRGDIFEVYNGLYKILK